MARVPDRRGQKTTPSGEVVRHAPGEVLLGRYELVEEVGQGGMGVVWRAHDRRMDETVAVKLLHPWMATNKRALTDLREEARLSFKLSHPSILRLRTFEVDDSRTPPAAFLVMDYIEGQTLDDLLVDHRDGLSLNLIGWWAPMIADAIDFAHKRGVLHRDIKPANIMLAGDGRAMLMDFGIARTLSDTQTRLTGNDSSGSLNYMSPQQLSGSNDRSNDIYSFAVTLYESLNGQPPFHTGDVARQIHDQSPPVLGDPVWGPAVMRGLAKHPEERPGSAAELVEPCTRGSVDRGPGPAADHKTRGRGRMRVWVSGAVLLVVLLLVGLYLSKPRTVRITNDLVVGNGSIEGLVCEYQPLLFITSDGLLFDTIASDFIGMHRTTGTAGVADAKIEALRSNEIKELQVFRSQHRHEASPEDLEWAQWRLSADRSTIATVSYADDETVLVRDFASGETISEIETGAHYGFALSPDGSAMIIVRGSSFIEVFDTATGRSIAHPVIPSGMAARALYSPSGENAAVAYIDRSESVPRLKVCVLAINSMNGVAFISTIDLGSDRKVDLDSTIAMAFVDDTDRLLVASDLSDGIDVINCRTGRIIKKYRGLGIKHRDTQWMRSPKFVQFSQGLDRLFISSAGYEPPSGRDSKPRDVSVVVYDLERLLQR